jgi:hypothetical protein
MDTDQVDDEAYLIYFTVAEMESEGRENGIVKVELIV